MIKGLVFDTSLGRKKLAKHFEKLTGIPCFTRRDVAHKLHINPQWKVRDSKFLSFAKENGYVLITDDWGMYKRAIKRGIRAIFVWNKLPFWTKIFRILNKLDHPFFFLSNFIDLRRSWHYGDNWRIPKNPTKCIEIQLQDKTYIWR